MATNELPELLRPAEACDVLRVSYPTLRRMIRRGDLHAVRLGSGHGASLRVPASELHRLLEPTRGDVA